MLQSGGSSPDVHGAAAAQSQSPSVYLLRAGRVRQRVRCPFSLAHGLRRRSGQRRVEREGIRQRETGIMGLEWVIGAALGFGLHGRQNTKPRPHDVISASVPITFSLDDGSTHVQEISSPGKPGTGRPRTLRGLRPKSSPSWRRCSKLWTSMFAHSLRGVPVPGRRGAVWHPRPGGRPSRGRPRSRARQCS